MHNSMTYEKGENLSKSKVLNIDVNKNVDVSILYF